MSGSDFNALFIPMKNRGAIVQYDKESSELDENDKHMIDAIFADRAGASYFFVVARSSPEGATGFNSELSHARASAVLAHLQEQFNDPDLAHAIEKFNRNVLLIARPNGGHATDHTDTVVACEFVASRL